MHAKPKLNTVIQKTPCDGFGTGVCWLVPGPPLWGLHFRTRADAENAVSRASYRGRRAAERQKAARAGRNKMAAGAPKKPPLRLLDLFSGIGGFSLGLERSGAFGTVAFCEIEPFCQRVLAKHWPGIPIYDDIRELTADTLGRDGITVDAICGGFPCQDISLAGDGDGIEGGRSGLWAEYARLIGEIQPRWVIVENVAELLNRGMGRVLGTLATLGYDAEWHCIPAAAVGAPHLRDRVWILAYPHGTRQPGQGPIVRLSEAGEEARIAWDAIADEASNGFRALRAGCATSPKPLIRRGDDGFSDWTHRIRAIGNAVVPQIPEMLGRAIAEIENG